MNNLKRELAGLQNIVDRYELGVVQKLLFITMFCFSGTLIGVYISYVLGNNYFLLAGKTISNTVVIFACNCTLFMIHMFFTFSICLGLYERRSLCITVAYIPLHIMAVFIWKDSLITSTLIPLVYILIHAALDKSIIKTAFRWIGYHIIIGVYQYLALMVKIGMFEWDAYSFMFWDGILFSIDFILFNIILYFIIGGKKHANQWVVRTKDIESASFDYEDYKALAEFETLSKKQRFLSLLLLSAFQLFQMLLILGISAIGNVFIECVFTMLSYLAYCIVIKHRLHCENVSVCTIISMALFYVASKITLPVNISMYVPILIGFLTAYSLYLMQVHIEEFEYYKKHSS